jgi:Glyoxalase-like domain
VTVPLRLCGALVDVPRADHEKAVTFWAQALGKPAAVSEAFPDYAQFDAVTPGVYFMVQATADDTRRIHLDLDSHDVEADVARLQALGATEIGRSHHWVVMRDPAGVTFCVVAHDPSSAAEPTASPAS